jgi:hypothetical protein
MKGVNNMPRDGAQGGSVWMREGGVAKILHGLLKVGLGDGGDLRGMVCEQQAGTLSLC